MGACSTPGMKPTHRSARVAFIASIVPLTMILLGGNAIAATVTTSSSSTASISRQAESPPALPPIVEEGLDQRLKSLPRNPTDQQLVAAMYPGDNAAQKIVLARFRQDKFQDRGVGDTAWKITKCAGALGMFVAGNALLVTKAAKLGGVAKGAILIVRAGTREEKLKLLLATFGEVTGISAVATACG